MAVYFEAFSRCAPVSPPVYCFSQCTDAQNKHGNNKKDALQQQIVTVKDGIPNQLADTGIFKDVFYNERSVKQRLQAEQKTGDNRI